MPLISDISQINKIITMIRLEYHTKLTDDLSQDMPNKFKEPNSLLNCRRQGARNKSGLRNYKGKLNPKREDYSYVSTKSLSRKSSIDNLQL